MGKSCLTACAIAMVAIFSSSNVQASTSLECVIDFYRAPNSGGDLIAVVGGVAKNEGNSPVYVTVKNGPGTYTTTASRDGRWTLTFKILGNRLSAEVWTDLDRAAVCQDLKNISFLVNASDITQITAP